MQDRVRMSARMARQVKHGWETSLCMMMTKTEKNRSHHCQIPFTYLIHASLLVAY
jgi:hypothetical protein